MKMISGVYLIENTVNGKRYVGSSYRVPVRLRDHFKGYGSVLVWRAIKKYGRDALVTSVLEECERDQLPISEAKWIAALKPEYNLDSLTTSGGRIVNASTRALMSAAKKGKPGHRAGQKHSPETRALMSAAKKGKPGLRTGHRHSAQSRALMSAARRGVKLLPEHKAKIAASSGGWRHSEEAKAKIAAAKRGFSRLRPQNEKLAISSSVKKLWQNPDYRARQMQARRASYSK